MALIETDDVARLFRGLVELLAEREPTRLHSPFQVAELYQQLIPYRVHRARLGFDTHQDYEAAILGLLAGIGGYATVEPPEAQETLAAEAASPNPDPGLVREFAGARVHLNAARARALLDADSTFAPPPPAPEPVLAPPLAQTEEIRGPVFALDVETPVAPPPPPPSPPSPAASPSRCHGCGGELPSDRPTVFCPWCGKPVGVLQCRRCGDTLEPAWGFCPRCGEAQRR